MTLKIACSNEIQSGIFSELGLTYFPTGGAISHEGIVRNSTNDAPLDPNPWIQRVHCFFSPGVVKQAAVPLSRATFRFVRIVSVV